MTDEHATGIWIRGAGDYCAAATDPLPALKGVVQATLGTSVRRIGRFIQLALIGTGRCVAGRAPNASTAVYMSSARGDLETTLDVLETLFREGMPPMPLSFVNTVSNAPCYYVARHFELAGRSSFICSRCFAFEAMLDLATLDLQSGDMDAVLAGSVDIATAPIADHRQRLRIGVDEPVAEGSHWLWLQTGEQPADAIGRLLAVREFADRDEMLDWLRTQSLPSDDCQFALGQFADAEDATAVRQATHLERRFQAEPVPGYYDSQTGGTLTAFLRASEARQLLHINGEIDGSRYAVVWLERCQQGGAVA